jgi:hypothetical protein
MTIGRLQVVGVRTPGKDATVDFGMQRLDAAVHHLGEPGDVRNIENREPRGGQRLGGAAGGYEFEPARRQFLRERNQAGFIGNAQNCTRHRRFDTQT